VFRKEKDQFAVARMCRATCEQNRSFRSAQFLGNAAISVKGNNVEPVGVVQDGFHNTQSRTRRFAAAFQALSLYVSAAIAACGWGISHLFNFDGGPYLLLWFAGATLVYNIDRLRPDPADLLNIPQRHAAFARLSRLSRALVATSLLSLIVLPVFMQKWLLLALTLTAALVCICYSLRPLGFRLKDVPVLKSLFAPTIAAAAFLVPPLCYGFLDNSAGYAIETASWLWMFLCFNMILCDLRDILGDSREGIRSIPVLIGARTTRSILRLIFIATLATGIFNALSAPTELRDLWIALALITAAYQWHLLRTPEAKRNEAYYEWRVEGMLFIPALAVLIRASL
jgi:4-hydroxybenzoate polyprenyltransferase